MKISLGCGKRNMPGYVHVDLSDYPHVDYKHDVRSLPMFADGQADLIYASHVLEYFDPVEVVEVLREWSRVLHAGGTLRLAVPDFAALAEVYLESSNLNLIHGPLYGREQMREGQIIYHRTVYDYLSLARVLENNGYEGVRAWNWREVFSGELAGYDDYSRAYIPHMDFERGRLISLNVEATRL